MKRILMIVMITTMLFTVGSAAWYVSRLNPSRTAAGHADNTGNTNEASREKLNTVAIAAKEYAAAHQFNTSFCFLVDMQIASGRQRFFVYDISHKKIIKTGLVTHGRCNKDWLTGRQYGNATGCGCTSLGRYKVGNSYQGKFGLAYKLFGLDNTNSNAYARFVVLHSMPCVPEKEVDPYPICQSDGCPTVSPEFLKELAPMIDKSKEPVLLWIYD